MPPPMYRSAQYHDFISFSSFSIYINRNKFGFSTLLPFSSIVTDAILRMTPLCLTVEPVACFECLLFLQSKLCILTERLAALHSCKYVHLFLQIINFTCYEMKMLNKLCGLLCNQAGTTCLIILLN